MSTQQTPINGAPVDTVKVEERKLDPAALRSVYVNLSFSAFGNSAQADVSEIETAADKECLTITKRLLVGPTGKAAPELAAITSGDSELKNWLKKRAFKSMFRSGIYRAPYALLGSIDEKFKEYEERRRTELVPALLDAYPRIIQASLLKLKGQGRADDYLSSDELAATFNMRWNYFILDTPLALAAIRQDLFQNERNKIADTVRDEVEAIRLALRSEMKDLVAHMVERLTGVDDKGKPKIFRDTMLGNIREFFGLFEARNLTDDSELRALVDKAKGLLVGVNEDSLRDSSSVRKAIRTNFSSIQTALDGMMQNKPQRSITFED